MRQVRTMRKRPSDETGGDKETIRGDRWGQRERDHQRRQVEMKRPSEETGEDNEKETIR
jgi:hypothetical protein